MEGGVEDSIAVKQSAEKRGHVPSSREEHHEGSCRTRAMDIAEGVSGKIRKRGISSRSPIYERKYSGKD